MATGSSFWLEVLKKGGDFFSNVSEEILGEKVKAQLEDKLQPVLKLLASPEGRKAFDKAFAQATTQFKRGATTSDERQFRDEIVKLLDHTTKKGVEEASREVIQSYVLASEPDRTKLDRWVQRQLSFTNFSVGKRTYTPQEVTEALDEFFVDLGRSFWDQELFREKAIQAKTTQLLRQILEELRQQAPDLAAMRRDYLDYLGRCYAYLDLGGIAPKVNNRTVKLMMRDIYVPIEAEHELNWNQLLISFGRAAAEKEITKLEDLSVILEKNIDLTILEQMQQAVQEFSTLASTLSYEEVSAGWQVLQEKLPQNIVKEKVDIERILTEPRTVLLGHPGTGKSTTLRYIAFALATGLTEQLSEAVVDRLPILVRLVKYAKVQKQNPALTLRDYVRDVHDRERSQLFRDALENGECLVMLDGLDEIIDPNLRAEITDEVEALVAEYADNHFLVSSRIIGYETSWLTGDFAHFTIGALPEKSIQTFLQKWYEAIEREGGVDEDEEAVAKASALTEAIQNRPGMKRLAENPLLLTIIALVNQKERRLPNRRIEVYRYAAETLVESWPRVHRSVVFDSEEVLSLLAPVAYRIFGQQSSEEIAEETLLEMLVEIIPRLKPNLSKTEATSYLRDLLPQLSEHSGLFLERGFDAEKNQRLFGFLHLTFAEYLAARHLASQWEAEKNDRKRQAFLAKYAPVPRWREVFLLMVAYVGLDGRRNAATQILADILQMNLPYEEQLHRRILLAGRCLADDLRVESEAAAWVFRQLTDILLQTPITPLRNQIVEINQVAQGSLYRDEISALMLDKLSQEESEDVRASIASALGQIGSEAVVEALVGQLSQEGNKYVRASIASALGQIGSEEAVEALVGQLSQEGNEDVRASIASALGQIGSEEAVASLVEQLRLAESEDARTSFTWSLGRVRSEAAVGSLVGQLRQEESEWVRGSIAFALGQIGSEVAVESLLRQLGQEESEPVRVSIFMALGQIRSEAVVETLLEQLGQEESEWVRSKIIWALGQLRSEAAVEPLLRQLSKEDPGVRYQTARALGQIGSEVAIEPLLRQLAEEYSKPMRNTIYIALAQIGSEAVAEMLIELLHETDDNDVLTNIANALVQMKSEAIVGTLLWQLRQAKSISVRARIAGALGQIGNEVMETLINQLSQEGVSWVRSQIARSLGQIGNEAVVEALMNQLSQEESEQVRISIAVALGQIGGEQVIQELFPLLTVSKAINFEPDEIRRTCDWAYEIILEIEAKHQVDPGKENLTPNQPIKGPWSQ